jgi:hypothetical protein
MVRKPVFILGRNGFEQESAPEDQFVCGTVERRKIVYMPGSRPSYFDSKAVHDTGES